ncbi:hypothetical protein F2P81_007928 [Scophthalmus maximus]|uniref:Ig-like domain-containing protein n=1 Tax=Scophthalmus maximus TaxID=52904 RepID=A0A6A4T0U3_SCOMX|nr:hypothetical protein F2P81_007928 [Scophthalmus maximus]
MSLTISSSSSSSTTASSSRELFSSSPGSSSSSGLLAQRHSSLVQPLCVSPQRTQSPIYNQQYSGNGVAPAFVKCLHDVSTVKGQLVVMECRLRGTPPLQVMWYREDEKILDSDDFRILRKKELCTLVITEAFPEDSGLFKCVALNSFGTASCSAILEVYNDLEEQLEIEALRQQEAVFQQETPPPGQSGGDDDDDFPPPLPDSVNLPPPEWPESPFEDNVPAADKYRQSSLPQSSQSGGDNMNLSDLPTFKPSTFPPSAFNYARPRHFIQSQPSFQAPSYESVLREAQENQNNSQQNLASSQNSLGVMETQSQAKIQSTQSQSFSQAQSVSRSLSQTQAQFQSLNLSQNQTQSAAQIQIQTQANGTGKSSPSSSSKLSYEERMARRLLGPDNATYMSDQDNLSDSQLDQPESPEGRHTGGLWGKHHSGTDGRGNEGSAIQEKCYAPRFLQIPPDLTVEEGRFCRIDFKVGGLPTPDVCWYLDGKAIRPDDYHKMLVCEKAMHSFIIEIVTVHHAGVYECVARNRAGESRFSMRLDVIAQEVLRPPTFVQKMLNSRALEGDTVRLECKVEASPPPQLFWKKDKDMLRIDPSRMSLYQDGSGRQCLLMERVMKSDAGWYTLSAINEAGMSTCNARLDVGTRKAQPMKTAPPGSKTLKLLSSLSHVPALTVESPAQHTAQHTAPHTAPLYESEEL